MQLNVKSSFGVIWCYMLPSKFRGILFSFLNIGIQKSITILRKTCKNRDRTFESHMSKPFRKLFFACTECKLMLKL